MDRTSVNSQIHFGKPYITGTGITVSSNAKLNIIYVSLRVERSETTQLQKFWAN
jgi:hypothetical protein